MAELNAGEWLVAVTRWSAVRLADPPLQGAAVTTAAIPPAAAAAAAAHFHFEGLRAMWRAS